MTTVHFVCIGNTCRSPMAAEIFNQMLRERSVHGYRGDSFGTMPFYGDDGQVKPLREAAVENVMGEVNGLKGHKPKGAESVVFQNLDIIVLLVRDKLDELMGQIKVNPSMMRGTHLLVIIMDTEDPFGGTVEKYIDCCRFLRKGLEEHFDDLTGMRDS